MIIQNSKVSYGDLNNMPKVHKTVKSILCHSTFFRTPKMSDFCPISHQKWKFWRMNCFENFSKIKFFWIFKKFRISMRISVPIMMLTMCSPVLLMLYLLKLLLFTSYQNWCLQKCAKMPKKAKKLLIIRYYSFGSYLVTQASRPSPHVNSAFVNASVPHFEWSQCTLTYL